MTALPTDLELNSLAEKCARATNFAYDKDGTVYIPSHKAHGVELLPLYRINVPMSALDREFYAQARAQIPQLVRMARAMLVMQSGLSNDLIHTHKVGEVADRENNFGYCVACDVLDRADAILEGRDG